MRLLYLALVAAAAIVAPIGAQAVENPTYNTVPATVAPRGLTGPAGCSLLTTAGAPASGAGKICDVAIDPTAGLVYGPKSGSGWPAGVALGYATQSASSAAAAAASAVAAGASATAAGNAQTNAAGILDQLFASYLGAFPDDPSAAAFATAKGVIVQVGALYFNTASTKLRVFNGSSWSDYDAAAQSAAGAAASSASAAAASAASIAAGPVASVAGQTGAVTASALQSALANASRANVADANATVAPGALTVAYTSLTAPRTATAPAASAVAAGLRILFVDEAGAAGPTKAITIAAAGSDTINGGASVAILTPFGHRLLESNGVSKWTVVASSLDAPPVIRSYLAGLTLSNDATAPTTTLDIGGGQAADAQNLTMINAPNGAVKTITAAWAAGSGNGGMGNGLSAAASTWYHVCLAANGGAPDVYFDTFPDCSHRPSAITDSHVRRIGSIRTDASTHILAFAQNGDEFLWSVPVSDLNSATLGTTAVAVTLSVPSGVRVNALYNFVATCASPAVLLMNALDAALAAPTAVVGNATGNLGSGPVSGQFSVRTNTSGQIRVVSTTASTTLEIATYGWVDRRGRDL